MLSLLGPVEICIRPGDQLIGIDGRREVPGQSEGRAGDRQIGRRCRLQDGEELVSTDPCNEGTGTERGHETLTDRSDGGVACGVALAVVDRLQAVDVAGHHRDAVVPGEPRRQVLEERPAVRKPGQDVLECQALERACVRRNERPNAKVGNAPEEAAQERNTGVERCFTGDENA
jgi:hypothetical protein